MENPQISIFMPLFGKQWIESCIAYTGRSCPQLVLFLQVWYVISLLYTARDLTLWVYDFGSVTAMGAWAKICASIVAQVTFPFPGEKDGGLASTRLIAPSERANNMITTI